MFGLDLAATIGITFAAVSLAIARPLGPILQDVIMKAAQRAAALDELENGSIKPSHLDASRQCPR
jgi:hypothetical protein